MLMWVLDVACPRPCKCRMVITYALMEKLEELADTQPDRVQVLKKARVTKLLQDASGAVTGVEYEFKGQKYTENGVVILATGGYAADFEKDGMLAKYRPDTLNLSTTNGDHCTGDGLKMAMSIGARGIDLEKVQVHPTGLIDPKDQQAKVKFLAAEALRGAGGILLDGKGNRFCDELGTRDYVRLPVPIFRGQRQMLMPLFLSVGHRKNLGERCLPCSPHSQRRRIEGN